VRARQRLAADHHEDDAYALNREIDESRPPRHRCAAVAGSGGQHQLVHSVLRHLAGIPRGTRLPVVEGRGFEQAEINGAGKVALIGQTVAQNLFGESSPLDQVVRITKVPLTIIACSTARART